MNSSIVIVNDQNFKSEVINYKGYVLVDFWAEWCGPCRSLMPYVEQLAKDRIGRIKVCKFNIDNSTIPNDLGIRSIPTLIIWQNGKEKARDSKFNTPTDLLNWVDSKMHKNIL